MKGYKFCAFLLIFVLLFTYKVYATTISINPSAQDSPIVGGKFNFSVKIDNVENLAGYQFSLAFDKSLIKFLNADEGAFFKTNNEDGMTFFIADGKVGIVPKEIDSEAINKVNSTGAITITGAKFNDKVVKGSGDLIVFTFECISEIKTTTKLALKDVILSKPIEDPKNPEKSIIIADIVSGSINSYCVKGDVNADGFVRIDDVLLVLNFVAGTKAPTAQQLCSADMNNDRKIKIDDAIAIFRKINGLGAPAKNAEPQIVKIKLDEIYGLSGEDIIVPIKIDNSDLVAGGDIWITYDPSTLRFVNVSSQPGILLADSISQPGILKLAFACLDNTNNQKFAEVSFNVISDSTSPLTFQKVELYRHDLMPLNLKKIDGRFTSWALPPKEDALLQNYPNPFNPETWFPYQLRNGSEVSVRIYSATGELVRELDLGYKPAGVYVNKERSAYWDGKDKFGVSVASGIYFYSIKTKDFSAVKKMTILK